MNMVFNPCILIPTFNHTDKLADILDTIDRQALPVLIVDDGSAPTCHHILEQLAATRPRVSCISHTRNRGKGAAVQTGFRELIARGYSHALQIDADGQHDLDAITPFLKLSTDHPNAVVAGQPVFDDTIPRARRYGRRITDFWVVIHTLGRLRCDSMCGFRVYPLAAVERLMASGGLGRRMDFDTDMLVRLFWQETPIVTLPVRVTYPSGNHSNFDMWQDNVAITLMHTRLFFGMVGRLPQQALGSLHQTTDPNAGNNRHWAEIRERGSFWGLWFLARVYRLLGRRACIALMAPAVCYFFLTGSEQRRASQDFFHRIHQAGLWPQKPNLLTSLRHYFSFANAMLDIVSAWTGGISPASLKGVDQGAFAAAKSRGEGLFIVTAHIGNPQMIRAVATTHQRWRVNVLMHTHHAESFNRMLKRFAPEAPVRLFQVSDLGAETIFTLQDALARGEWVVATADRLPVNTPSRSNEFAFLGRKAAFPQGPFILASLLKCPIYTLFCIRSRNGYTVHFEKLTECLDLPRASRSARLQPIMQEFVRRLELQVREAPMQWYNFYEFWRPT